MQTARAVGTALVLLLAAGTVAAQAIDTNRPGFSFSPNVVPKGRWQVETGFAYTRIDSDADFISLPNAELRFGTADRLELFVSSLNWADVDTPGGSSSGLLDVAIGAKVDIANADAKFRTALLLQFSVPVGDSRFSSDRMDPTLGFIWAGTTGLPFAGTVKLTDFEDNLQLDNGLKLPFSINETQSAFVEWEANIPESGGATHWLNGGFQWLLDDNLQLDFSAGLGLNDRSGDYRWGVGISYRPKY
ncbi:MAG: transporter [Woeseiaceae bacterium]|nr:transporter [Woeseiaceae bacterium]